MRIVRASQNGVFAFVYGKKKGRSHSVIGQVLKPGPLYDLCGYRWRFLIYFFSIPVLVFVE